MRILVALLLIVSVATSCSHGSKPSDNMEGGADATLHVENHHYGDVDIFVVHNGSRTRVGSVTASSEQTFTLNSRVIGTVGTLQILAHGIGEAGSLSSEQFSIRPGMQISWTLDSNLSRATLAIY
jgi:hypothetical protein